MVLLELLPLLAATVALADALQCPSAPFNDLSESASMDCVGGNFRLTCPNDASVTVHLDDLATSFDLVISVSDAWFGLKCGATPKLLDARPTLYCPPPACDRQCPFVNGGGIVPKSSCRNGNPVKSCDGGGKLFVGNEEYKAAECVAGGKWIVWNCDGLVAIDGPLTAACSRPQCTQPRWFESIGTYFREFSLVTSERTIVSSNGESRIVCGAGTILAYRAGPNSLARPPPDAFFRCVVGEDEWIIQNEYEEFDEEGVGCITHGCTDAIFLDGSESGLAQIQLKLVKNAVEYNYDSRLFEFECPTGSALYSLNGAAFALETTKKFTCSVDGWVGSNATHADFPLVVTRKYGCFAQQCLTQLTYLKESQVAALIGTTVDTSQIATFVDGAHRLKCSPGSAFAYISSAGKFTVENWYMTCAGGAEWAVKKDRGLPDGEYIALAVGCIKPSCAALNLFDGNEAFVEARPQYEFVATHPTYVGGKWELVCPSDCSIGYAESPALFQFVPTMRVTCEAAGWWARTSVDAAGHALLPVKIGCFRKHVPSAKCPAPPLLTQSLVSPWVGVTVDASTAIETLPLGKYQLKCAPPSVFAYIKVLNSTYSALWSTAWWMDCDNAGTTGWRVRDAGGRDTDYLNPVVGCIKPTCTGLRLFDGYETLLWKHPTYQFIHNVIPTYPADRFELVCPPGAGIGYALAEDFIIYDETMRIRCQEDGWGVTADGIDSLLAPDSNIQFGCFMKK